MSEFLEKGADPKVRKADAQLPPWHVANKEIDHIAESLIKYDAHPEPGPDEDALKALTQKRESEI